MKRTTAATSKAFGWTGIPVPTIGQGTWHMGESRRARSAEAAAIGLGIDLGLSHIDTAEMYGGGGAEEAVAEAIRGRKRADLFLASKVLPQHATYSGTMRAAEQSLARLGTDYLDLYMLHWPGSHPIAETMRAMEDLVAARMIRFIGVSNFDVDEMRGAIGALRKERLACNQVLYNLGRRGIERDLIPFCAEEGIAVVGYTPFGGFPPAPSDGFRVLEDIGRSRGKTPRQVALAFLTRQSNVFAIPKSSDPEHVRENAGTAEIELSEADVEAIDRAFAAPRRKVPLAFG